MPANAMRHVRVDHVVPVAAIGQLLVRLTQAPEVAAEAGAVPVQVEVEVKIAKEDHPLAAGLERVAKPSSFACPECHGVLLQIEEGGRIRFRCHTGHAYSIESLLAAIGEGIEKSLWGAVRALEEGTMLMEQVADHLRTHDGSRDVDVASLASRSEEARRHADTVRRLLTDREPLAPAKQ